MMSRAGPILRRLSPAALPTARRSAVSRETLAEAAAIVDDIRCRGEAALRHHALLLGDVDSQSPLIIERPELQAALAALPSGPRSVLERCADRIRCFAQAQRAALQPLTVDLPGGAAGHTLSPVARAGCYAPGGRFPLPSSVLMTALVARVAGVGSVWVASPRPAPITLAAAALAGADAVLAVGGAQAIAALAYGTGSIPPCDAVVGPGNRWVTAAKQLVAGQVAIDMLAGPSELVVLADHTADPILVAADLLAQAEHDPDALPVLVALDESLLEAVELELDRQLVDLPTAPLARQSLANGFAVLAPDLNCAVEICDALAPEHLELWIADAEPVVHRLQHYGALFIGGAAAEVLGDYAAGPNHTLPTGGTARFTGGLSVLTFIRVRTWLRIDAPEQAESIARDAADFARLEGLEAHARAAELRVPSRFGGC